MGRHRGKWAVLFVSVLLLVAACGGGSGGASADTIKIGVPVPLTGDYASAGEAILNAAKLAAQEINDQGGLLGKKVEVIGQDDQCDSQVGVQAAQKLISQGIVAAVGGYCSSASIPEAGEFAKKDIPFLLDASTNPVLTEKNPGTVFRICGRDDEQGPVAMSFMKDVLKAQTVGIIHDNTTYAKGLAEAARDAAESLGMTVVLFTTITPGEKDFSSTVTAVKRADPDALYFTGYHAEGGLLVKQAWEMGLRAALVVSDANQDPTFLQTAGSAANGVYVTTAPLAEFIPAAQGFVQKYKDTFKAPPGGFSVYEYDAMHVLLDAIKRANSTDPKAIVTALKETKDFPGITGNITFNTQGDRSDKLYMVAVAENGQFQPYMRIVNGQWQKVQ
ncbi:MAG: branched-chain amino acid ABC transporter substrate-binding protein [Bacillota bacterium]|nr:branched-chain amino acid ABC transporter substrate-binding protein [Bacillota bacterium]